MPLGLLKFFAHIIFDIYTWDRNKKYKMNKKPKAECLIVCLVVMLSFPSNINILKDAMKDTLQLIQLGFSNKCNKYLTIGGFPNKIKTKKK